MNKVYVMVGLPGSGKSTVAKTLDGTLISTDSIREELYGDENIQGDGRLVFSIAFCRAREALERGENVIFDATNVSRKARKGVLKATPGAEHVAVFVNTPFEECVKRNRSRVRVVPNEVLERMHKNLVPPTVEEGFAEVIEK